MKGRLRSEKTARESRAEKKAQAAGKRKHLRKGRERVVRFSRRRKLKSVLKHSEIKTVSR